MTRQKISSIQVKFSGCRVYKSAVQSITSGAYNYATFDTEAYDTDNYHNNVTNNTRLTVPTDGYYRVSWHVSWALGAGITDCWFIINGATGDRYAGQETPNMSVSNTVQSNGSTTVYMTAGQYVELMPFQTSGAGLNISAGASGTYFTIERLGV